MGGQKFKSSLLTSYAHTFSDIIGGAIQAGLKITDLKEFDYSLEGFDKIEQGKIPLSYILKA